MSDSSAVLPGYPDPLWIQAVALVRGEIERGVLKPGMRLAPERELCQQLGISRVTLRRALGHLVEEGVLSASRGRGWYVSQAAQPRKEWPNTLESFSETADRMGLTPHSEVLQNRVDPATIDQAERLGSTSDRKPASPATSTSTIAGKRRRWRTSCETRTPIPRPLFRIFRSLIHA